MDQGLKCPGVGAFATAPTSGLFIDMGPMVQACRSPPCVTAALTKVFGKDIAAHGEHLRPICSVQLFIAKPNKLTIAS